ncbi:MAG: protein kinase [Candidatus Aureabacteria bacterium]|nr:protein kinase [Candidatus Auribacterota bacterium]
MNNTPIKPFCPLCHREFSEDVKFCPFDGIRLAIRSSDSLEGNIFNQRYEIIQKIGEGGMGVVYRAKQLSTGKIVAVKIIHSAVEDFNTIQRFKREVKLQSMLQHPNIVNVFDFSETDDGKHYFVMDFVEGKSLKQILNDSGVIPLDKFFELSMQICDGIQYAHNKGIIHRDLKTDNIFVVALSHQNIVKILDFGLAKAIDIPDADQLSVSSTGITLGTPHYISPEQAKGDSSRIGPGSDLYSLGVILYQMLTNRLPFEASTPWGIIHKHIHDDPTPIKTYNTHISRELEKIIMKCLQKLPENRFLSVLDLKREIEKVKAKTKIKPYHPPQSEEKAKQGLPWIRSFLLVFMGISCGWISFYSESFFSKYYYPSDDRTHTASQQRTRLPLPPKLDKRIGKYDYDFSLPFASTGKLRIQTQPSDAEIWYCGQLLGSTPSVFGPFLPGIVSLEIRKKDYFPLNIEIEVEGNKIRTVQPLKLSPVSCHLLFELKNEEGGWCKLPKKGEIKIGSMEWREVDFPWIEENLHSQVYQVQIRIEGYKVITALPQNVNLSLGVSQKIEFMVKPYPELFYIRGREKISSGKHQEALRDFMKAVEIDPKYWEAWYWYGISSDKAGKLERACKAYHAYLNLAPKNAADYSKVKDRFISLIKIVLKSHSHFKRGVQKYRSNELDQAITEWDQALLINPALVKTYLWRGSAYSRKGDEERAFLDFNKALEMDPDNPLIYYERGAAYVRTGKKDLSIPEFTMAIEKKSRYADAYFERGKIYSEKYQYDLAVENLTKAIILDPEYFALPGYKLMHQIYRNAGLKKEAFEAYKKYLELIPGNILSQEQKGSLLMKEAAQ